MLFKSAHMLINDKSSNQKYSELNTCHYHYENKR